jgi:hypothetical protein
LPFDASSHPVDEPLVKEAAMATLTVQHDNYRDAGFELPWGELYPEAGFASNHTHQDWLSLWSLDASVFIKALMQQSTVVDFGPFLQLAVHGPGSMFRKLSQSCVERVNSCGKLVLHHQNTLLSTEETEMMVLLRMNSKLMLFLGQCYRGTDFAVLRAAIKAEAPAGHFDSAEDGDDDITEDQVFPADDILAVLCGDDGASREDGASDE